MNLSEFEQSLDYDSFYADDVFVEIGPENARIVFYEKQIRTENGQI